MSELPDFADLNPFGGPYSPQQLHDKYGLGGVALSARARCIADPLYLASEVMSTLWQANLLRTPAEQHVLVAKAMVAQVPILYVDARGTAKTTLLDEVGGVHQLLSYVDDSMLFLQASEQNAKALIKQVRVHFQVNEILRRLFPEYAMGTEGNAMSFSVPCRRVRSREESVEVGTPGSSLAGRHYDIIAGTDIWNENTTPPPCGRSTVEMMKGLVNWYAQSDGLLKGPEINPRAHKRLDSNRWHDGDGVGEIIRKEDRVGRRYFTRVIRGVKRDPDGNWISTWPEIKTPKMMAEIHDGPTMNAATWAANFCSDPLPEGGMHFQRKWFHSYGTGQTCQCKKRHGMPEKMDIAITMDPAFSDGKSVRQKGSRSGIVVSGISTENGNLYILDYAAGQWSPYQTIEELFKKLVFWRAVDPHLWVGIEETGGSRGLIAIFNSEMQRTGRFVPLRLIKPASRAKDSPDRIGPLHSHAEHFGIFHKPEHDEVLEELLRFGVADRNDLADALAFRAMDLYQYTPKVVDEEDDEPDQRNRLEGRDFVDIEKMIAPRPRAGMAWNRLFEGEN